MNFREFFKIAILIQKAFSTFQKFELYIHKWRDFINQKEVTFVYNLNRIDLMEKVTHATPLLQIMVHIHMSKDQYISLSFLLLLNKSTILLDVATWSSVSPREDKSLGCRKNN